MIPRVKSNAKSWWVATCVFGLCAAAVILVRAIPMESQGGKPLMEFVPLPVGEFLMGCAADDKHCNSDESPAHPVKITKPVELGKYEVTQAQWKSINGGQPSHFSGADRPVEMVSWDDIQDFLRN